MGGIAVRLDLIREEREAQACSVELQRVVVTALQGLEARVAAVAAVVLCLLAEVDLEPFRPALLSAGPGLTTATLTEHSQRGFVVAAACLAQLEGEI